MFRHRQTQGHSRAGRGCVSGLCSPGPPIQFSFIFHLLLSPCGNAFDKPGDRNLETEKLSALMYFFFLSVFLLPLRSYCDEIETAVYFVRVCQGLVPNLRITTQLNECIVFSDEEVDVRSMSVTGNNTTCDRPADLYIDASYDDQCGEGLDAKASACVGKDETIFRLVNLSCKDGSIINSTRTTSFGIPMGPLGPSSGASVEVARDTETIQTSPVDHVSLASQVGGAFDSPTTDPSKRFRHPLEQQSQLPKSYLSLLHLAGPRKLGLSLLLPRKAQVKVVTRTVA